jgi:hypothetical protein
MIEVRLEICSRLNTRSRLRFEASVFHAYLSIVVVPVNISRVCRATISSSLVRIT